MDGIHGLHIDNRRQERLMVSLSEQVVNILEWRTFSSHTCQLADSTWVHGGVRQLSLSAMPETSLQMQARGVAHSIAHWWSQSAYGSQYKVNSCTHISLPGTALHLPLLFNPSLLPHS